jgi:hypothetical protein
MGNQFTCGLRLHEYSSLPCSRFAERRAAWRWPARSTRSEPSPRRSRPSQGKPPSSPTCLEEARARDQARGPAPVGPDPARPTLFPAQWDRWPAQPQACSPAAAAPGQAGRQEALRPLDRSPQADQAALGRAEAPARGPGGRGPTRDSTASPTGTRDCSSESSSDATSAQASLAFASSSPPRPRRFALGCFASSATRSTDSRRAV